MVSRSAQAECDRRNGDGRKIMRMPKGWDGLGIYMIEWRDAVKSVACIYQDDDGTHMIAPSDWVKPGKLLNHVDYIKKMKRKCRSLRNVRILLDMP